MAWILITIAAYFFGAVANILDKFLLGSKRISSAPVYAFYMGVFGLGALLLAPFGASVPGGYILALCIFSGALFLAGTTFLYFAVERAEASRVVPVVGAVIPLASFILAYFFNIEKLSLVQILGMATLVFGGLLISFDLPLKIGKKKFFSGFYFSCAAGALMAFSYVIFKYISIQETFLTWYIWTRVGGFVGVMAMFVVPSWRAMILRSFLSAKKNNRRAYATGGIFIANKVVGGVSTLMLNYAINLGSVILLNALVSVQYVFVLVFAAALSRKNAHIFEEKLYFWDWAQKVVAIVVIGFGMAMIYYK